MQLHRKLYSIWYWAWCMEIATFFPQRFTAGKTRIHLDYCRTWKDSRQHAGSMQAARDPEQQVPFLNIRMRQHSLPLITNSGLFVPLLPPWDPSSTVTKSKENQGHLWSTVVTQQLPRMCWTYNAGMQENSIFQLCLETRCHWRGEAVIRKKRRKKVPFEAKYGAILSLS